MDEGREGKVKENRGQMKGQRSWELHSVLECQLRPTMYNVFMNARWAPREGDCAIEDPTNIQCRCGDVAHHGCLHYACAVCCAWPEVVDWRTTVLSFAMFQSFVSFSALFDTSL